MPSVVVGFVHGSHDVAFFHTSLRRMLDYDREHGHHVVRVLDSEASPRIAHYRNMLVEQFLLTDGQYLLMLDTDMAIPCDLIERLLKHANPETHPIVAGLYFGGRLHGEQHAHIYRLRAGGGALDAVEGTGGVRGQWGPLLPVHAAGAGCLLMHRTALEKVGEAFESTGFPWFVEGRGSIGGDQAIDIGEDVAFCLRAVHLGIPIHADTSTILGHIKLGIIDEKTHLAYLADREAMGEQGVAQDMLARLRLNEPQEVKP